MDIIKKTFTVSNDGTMPSVFPSIDSKQSRPLASRQELEDLILRNTSVAGITEAYRKTLAVSKELADGKVKPMSPAVCFAAQLDGRGRLLENVVGEVGCLALDYDHVAPDAMQPLFDRIKLAAYTIAAYRTVSGRGFRIVISYLRPEGCELSYVELHQAMLQKAMAFFDNLLGIKADRQCVDFLRLSGLAHDEQAYFNWDAEPLTLTDKELAKVSAGLLRKKTAKKATASRSKSAKGGVGKAAKLSAEPPTMAEAAKHVLGLLESWGFVFEPHRHNEYVLHFGSICNRYGIDFKDVVDYADAHFSNDYPDTASVLRSCYKKTERFGTWHFFRDGESFRGQTSVRYIKQWLAMRYQIQRNMVTGRHEITSRLADKPKYLRWVNIDDDILNSLWVEMEEGGMSVNMQKLVSIIHSDFARKCDPLEDYLRSLPLWDGKRDFIGELADRIHIVPQEGYHHDQETFRKYFRKWMVAMVVGWVTPSVVNQMMLILVGKGGIYKSTFFNYLLPPQLRDYYLNESAAVYTDKDFMEAFSCKILMCLDEFDTTFGKNLNAFKSNMTKLHFSIRRPYDRFRSDLDHRASVAGTTNNQQIITDLENRRYSPWIVDSIVSPIDVPLDYVGFYSQAVALGREVTERKKRGEDGWVYWLTPEDIVEMQRHNSLFMVPNYAEEQIKRFYRVPKPDTQPQFIKFRYTAEIVERIFTNPAMRKNFEHQNVGSIMARLGFPKAHRRKGNGWFVIEIEGADQNRLSSFNGDEDKDAL